MYTRSGSSRSEEFHIISSFILSLKLFHGIFKWILFHFFLLSLFLSQKNGLPSIMSDLAQARSDRWRETNFFFQTFDSVDFSDKKEQWRMKENKKRGRYERGRNERGRKVNEKTLKEKLLFQWIKSSKRERRRIRRAWFTSYKEALELLEQWQEQRTWISFSLPRIIFRKTILSLSPPFLFLSLSFSPRSEKILLPLQ